VRQLPEGRSRPHRPPPAVETHPLGAHFARLAAQVPIRQLIVRHDADALGALTDAILEDLARL